MSTFDPNDWILGAEASKLFGLPIELIAQGMVRDQVRIALVEGSPMVNRGDVAAMALRLKGGRCDGQ